MRCLILLKPMKDLDPLDIINHGNFFQRTLLSASAFVNFCKERGIDISEERLEKLEKVAIFLPALRVRYPEIKIKQKRIKTKGQPDRIEEFGILEDGEQWDGELAKDYSAFIPFDARYVASWIDEGLISGPRKGEFAPWSKYTDKQGHHKATTYYSIFQAYSLKSVLRRLRVTIDLENLPSRTEREAVEIHRRWKKYFKDFVLRVTENNRDEYWKLCHFLSQRYLPEAESDGLLITVPAKDFTKFDFFEFRRAWNPKDFLEYIECTTDEIKDAWEWLVHSADWENPLSRWDDLVALVKRERRKQLKGDALLAELLKTMARMLMLFYKELTGIELYPRGDSPEEVEVFRGKGVTKDDLRYKEFVANEFGVNPRPKLILMVEGHGEFTEIPKLLLWSFGKSISSYGIQIVNLETISEFSSDKMVRFIDHYHHLQTIVYFVLDNENRARQTRDSLLRRRSRYVQGLSLTKKDFFRIWDRNIEFDNFSDLEIADALSKFSELRYRFREQEVIQVRDAFGREADGLSNLYRSKVNYGLTKPLFLGLLFENFKNDYRVVIDGITRTRPILEVIDDVRHLALRNYQPSSLEAWSENQHADWLRTKLP